MKVLLKKDVKGTGRAGEIVNVSDGYARNFLIPKALATPADASNINAANLMKSAEQHRKQVEKQNAIKTAQELNGKVVKITAKAGDNGKLFGSITSKEISEALMEQFGLDINKKKIQLAEPIKTLGTTEVTAHMYENETGKFMVEIVGQ